jgi:hypothetical protein
MAGRPETRAAWRAFSSAFSTKLGAVSSAASSLNSETSRKV